jgi:hypothetical protein
MKNEKHKDNEASSEAERKPAGLNAVIEAIRQNLRPGGPPVDHAAIALHVAGELDEEQSQLVRQQIVTWETWNREYWDAFLALGDADQSTT